MVRKTLLKTIAIGERDRAQPKIQEISGDL